MSVYKRGGVYWYKFIWQGKLIRASAKTGNKRLAEQVESAHKTRLVKIEAGLEEANPTPAKPVPIFPDGMKAFLDWSKTSHKYETWRRYKTSSVALLKYFGKRKLSDVETEDAEEFVKWRLKQTCKAPAKLLKKNPKATTNRPIKPSTVNRELACLRTMFYYHIEKGVKLTNPIRDFKFLEENEDTFYILSEEEEQTYLAECSQPLHDVAVIILETGMRPEEVYEMQRRHLHFDKGYYQNPSGKTKAARRRIELTARAIELLKERLEEVEGPWVFPSTRKEGVPLTKLNNAHYGALKRSQLRRFRIYDLRHTFATRILESGAVDPITLMHMLGHKRLDMVLKYAHPSDEHKRRAMLKFESFRKERSEQKITEIQYDQT